MRINITFQSNSNTIEQANFIYSPLGKAWEKQRKAVEEQGEKQIKSIEDDKNNYLLIYCLKKRKIFKNIYKERFNKKEELTNKINYDELKYIVYNSNKETDFSELKKSSSYLEDIWANEITIEQVRDKQEQFNKYLKQKRIGNKPEEQK